MNAKTAAVTLLADEVAAVPLAETAAVTPAAVAPVQTRRPIPVADEETQLVAACRAGDRAAMRTLYERYRRRIHSLVSRIAGDQDGEELVQEVFLKAFRSIDKFRGEAQFGTWLYRLAVNAALSQVSRSKNRRKAPEALLEGLAAPAPAAMTTGDPKLRDRLAQALAELPAGYRAVLVLHDVEGLQHEEISEVLGCRVGTSKSQLHKARARMRELLGPAVAAERAAGLGASAGLSGRFGEPH